MLTSQASQTHDDLLVGKIGGDTYCQIGQISDSSCFFYVVINKNEWMALMHRDNHRL